MMGSASGLNGSGGGERPAVAKYMIIRVQNHKRIIKQKGVK
jgi:hypothetical protein